MSNGNPQITVTVSWDSANSKWAFSGASDGSGNLVISKKGATPIRFERKSGETWSFVDPWIEFGAYGTPKNQSSIPGVLTKTGQGVDYVAINDINNQNPNTGGFYAYSLHTDQPNDPVIDPMIVNDGG